MIVVRLQGQMGNQMFQYAAGRAMAEKYGAELFLETTFIKKCKLSKYVLDLFHIQGKLISGRRLNKFLGDKLSSLREEAFHFDSTTFEHGPNVCMHGYFQSEKYFLDIAPSLREEFRPRRRQKGKNLQLAERIANTNSVSLHFRRCDYVTNPRANAFHGVLDFDYYHRCVENLISHVEDPHFYIFSDDPAWVEEHFHLPYPTIYINHNSGKKAYEDLRLMSQCKHQIVANSSFSWWAGWLNANPDKLVYAPKRWFLKESIDTKDLIPSSWIQL